ncbi:MAG: hypothetical protein JKX73_09450 [Flavobacteriales bacterium]|nr:hypothetical protein [Flavobacteriales bacterium]
MHKGIYTLGFAFLLAIGGLTVGCGNSGDGTEQHDTHDHGSYKCPMDCEAGKTYEEPGACPVCHMDLAEVETT